MSARVARHLLLAFACLAARPAAALWTCSTVAHRGSIDPFGGAFGTRFDFPSVNHAGDVVFTSRPGGATPRLYRYPAGGAPEVLAVGGDPAPGGSTFGRFEWVSIADGGWVGFLGDLAAGKGVFVGSAVGAFVRAAAIGSTLPSGGVANRFLSVSRVNAAGDIAMVIRVTGGPDGVFRYDRTLDLLEAIAVEGDVTDGGRRFCDGGFVKVGLGASGAVAFRALSKIDCADPTEPLRGGIFLYRPGLGLATAALQDGPTPVAGATYRGFYEEPEVNATDQVGFRAEFRGTATRTGVFLFDPATAATTLLVQTKGAAPATTGGLLANLGPQRLDDGGMTLFHARVDGGTATQGLFRYGAGGSEAVVLGNAVPTDVFGAGASFRPAGPLGYSHAGSHVAFTARVRNTVPPTASGGVFRCLP